VGIRAWPEIPQGTPWKEGICASFGVADPAEEAACAADFTREYYLEDDYDSYWASRNHARSSANITVPVLYAQGFLDDNVATDMIPLFFPHVTSEKRAFYSQHGHGVPGSRQYFHSYVHRWLDHFLLDKKNAALDVPTVLVEDNAKRWRAEADWPPSDAAPKRFWLAGDSSLGPMPGRAAAASFRDDGNGSEAAALAGVNHLRFLSGPLERPLHIAGAPVAHVVGSSDSTDTNWAIHVNDVAPDGTQRFVTRGYLDARHRESLERGVDLVPGTKYSFHWELHPRDHLFEAGHRILVVVKSSDAYVFSDEERAENTVYSGREGSWIEFPLIDDSARTFYENAPMPWPQ
jgi:X-Pro dipeptidyl-peptidase